MPPVAYTVSATLPDETMAREYTDWLLAGHVREVLRAGAATAAVVRIQEPVNPIRVETRYTFADHAGLDRYLRDHAPALRADGLRLFGPDRGVLFARTVGVILF